MDGKERKIVVIDLPTHPLVKVIKQVFDFYSGVIENIVGIYAFLLYEEERELK